MKWTVKLSKQAEKQFKNFPIDVQPNIAKAIEELEENPFCGDVKPLKTKQFKGRYRKRVSRYRIIFIPMPQSHVVEISAILLRNEKTYG